MGTRGPVPKRSEDRHRRNDPDVPLKVGKGAAVVSIPEPNKFWPDAVRRLWDSLADSGQSAFYEPSDWAYAYFLLDEMSRYVENERQNGQVLSSLLTGLSNLLVTEGDRRRVSVELVRAGSEEDEDAAMVAVMDEWRKDLTS